MNYIIDTFKAVKKWKPVLESLNLDGKYYEMIATYAEIYQLTPPNSWILLNLKIFSLINLNRKIEFVCDDTNINEIVYEKEIGDYNQLNLLKNPKTRIYVDGKIDNDLESQETKFYKDFANYVNKIPGKLVIYHIVESMEIIKKEDNNYYFQIISRIGNKIEDRKQKLNNINENN